MADHQSLTHQQKHELCLIAQLGCDRTTAQNFLGVTAAQLRDELLLDPAFAQQLQRAEATAEMQHMRNVHEAAKNEKNWRTSVWWLERRAPDRFGRRDAKPLSAAEWRALVVELADIILAEIAEADLRARLFTRLEAIAVVATDQLQPLPAIGSEGSSELETPGSTVDDLS